MTRPNPPPTGWLIAAPRSGAGKTTITLALIAALRRRGIAVATGKSGPDYIDPMFHAAAAGAPGVNLDSWAMAPTLLDGLAAHAAGASLLLVESAMGLFDGIAGEPGRCGTAADLAARLGLPVLLVLDVSGQSQTAAAIARGMHVHRAGVAVGGVVLNRVASERHRLAVTAAIEAAGLRVLGAVPRDASITLPERHLGLVQATEHPDLAARLADLAALAERHLDLDAILAKALPLRLSAGSCTALPPPGQRIALAQDAAFSFIYPHLTLGWRAAGAEIIPFSPLADQPPPPGCDVAWLPGGYPELHAGALATALRFQAGLAAFAATRPVHGECGGYMVLGTRLEDAAGVSHAMAGLLGHATSFAKRQMHLGYREATLLAHSPLGPAGATIRGHEFHYARLIDPGPDAPLAMLRDGLGQDLGPAGGRRGHVTASFFHAIATHETP
jgi:cobyrinic acid a,c-diamide synthase